MLGLHIDKPKIWRLRWNRVVYNIKNKHCVAHCLLIERVRVKKKHVFLFHSFSLSNGTRYAYHALQFFLSSIFSPPALLCHFVCVRICVQAEISRISLRVCSDDRYAVPLLRPHQYSIVGLIQSSTRFVFFLEIFLLPFTGRFFLSCRFSFSNHKLRRLPYDIFTCGRRRRSYGQWNVYTLVQAPLHILKLLIYTC